MAFLQYKTGAIKEKSNHRGDERTDDMYYLFSIFLDLKITNKRELEIFLS
jgi:hypothetical protein